MSQSLTVEVKVAWWLKPYIYLLTTFCILTGMQPCEYKLTKVVARAIKMRVK